MRESAYNMTRESDAPCEITLAAAIIEFAIIDFRLALQAGWIRNGEVQIGRRLLQKHKPRGVTWCARLQGAYVNRASLCDLVEFFKPGGAMDTWIDVAHLNISGDMIREKIGFTLPLSGGATLRC